MRILLLLLAASGAAIPSLVRAASSYVVIVTVDGLRSSVFAELGDAQLPSFTRMRKEGVSTLNARTDHDWTFTNPDHISIFTARQVETARGHRYTNPGIPAAGTTLHTVAGFYLRSIWDVAHDHGLKTGLYNAKPLQLNIIDASYNASTGAPDVIGADNGRDKIDVFVATETAPTLINSFLVAMTTQPHHLSWLHLAEPDKTGHSAGWETPLYRNSVKSIDTVLGTLLETFSADPTLRGRTTVILTSDHGGLGLTHADQTHPLNYTVPFIVWGADVNQPGDLYFINRPFRRDPGIARVPYSNPAATQPIRNIDAGNLALKLLGLPAIPDDGAFINQAQDLRVSLPSFILNLHDEGSQGVLLSWPTLGDGYVYTVQQRAGLDEAWQNVPGIWPSGARMFRAYPSGESGFYRVVATATAPTAPALALAAPVNPVPAVSPHLTRKSGGKQQRRPATLPDDGVTGRPLHLR